MHDPRMARRWYVRILTLVRLSFVLCAVLLVFTSLPGQALPVQDTPTPDKRIADADHLQSTHGPPEHKNNSHHRRSSFRNPQRQVHTPKAGLSAAFPGPNALPGLVYTSPGHSEFTDSHRQSGLGFSVWGNLHGGVLSNPDRRRSAKAVSGPLLDSRLSLMSRSALKKRHGLQSTKTYDSQAAERNLAGLAGFTQLGNLHRLLHCSIKARSAGGWYQPTKPFMPLHGYGAFAGCHYGLVKPSGDSAASKRPSIRSPARRTAILGLAITTELRGLPNRPSSPGGRFTRRVELEYRLRAEHAAVRLQWSTWLPTGHKTFPRGHHGYRRGSPVTNHVRMYIYSSSGNPRSAKQRQRSLVPTFEHAGIQSRPALWRTKNGRIPAASHPESHSQQLSSSGGTRSRLGAVHRNERRRNPQARSFLCKSMTGPSRQPHRRPISF
eukprot:scpid79520/ scgid4222/ 